MSVFTDKIFRKSLKNAIFLNKVFINCQFYNDVDNTSFNNCMFISCRFNNKHFSNNKIVSCNFIKSLMLKIPLHECEIIQSNFTRCRFVDCNSSNLIIVYNTFYHSNIESPIKKSKIKYNNLYTSSLRLDCEGTLFHKNEYYNSSISYIDLPVHDSFYKDLNQVPEGDIIVWKKLYCGYLAKLLIPADVERVTNISNKCRAKMAKVLEILTPTGENAQQMCSYHNTCFLYEVGKDVVAENWDNNPLNTCAGGIHFFMTKKQAEDYFFT